MKDSASASEEVNKIAHMARATVTRENRATLAADQRPFTSRTSLRATSHQSHPTFVATWTTSGDATCRHAGCQTGSVSQPPSFGFLPALSFLSTAPRLCTMPRHRHAIPCTRSAVYNPQPPTEPKIPSLRQRVRARKLSVCGPLR